MKTYWFIFCKEELLLQHIGNEYYIPCSEHAPIKLSPWNTLIHLPDMNGCSCRAIRIDAPVTNVPGFEMMGLRVSFDVLSEQQYLMAGKAAELLYWDVNTKFCGVCGGPMKFHTDISKRCTNCGKEVWPQLATAIIVRVERGDEILMVHGRNFRGNYYGLVAGFVETGETLEECVAREVWEETHVRIKNIRYFGSQPWPYPCGLMIGFVADYDGGEIHRDVSELSDAQWFSRNHLPDIPGKASIARQLIDDWLTDNK